MKFSILKILFISLTIFFNSNTYANDTYYEDWSGIYYLKTIYNGGKVKQSKHREFGLANIFKKNKSLLTKDYFNKKSKKVWMSHADQVYKLPKSFKVIASSENSKYAIVECTREKFFGVQFHP